MSIISHTQGYVRVCRQPEYWPEHTKNGKTISSRLLIPAMAGEFGWKKEDGSRADVDDTYIEFTCWGKTADTYAKLLSLGKEFYCEFRTKTYRKRVFVNRVAQKGPDGKDLMVRAESHEIIPGSIRLGKDGAKIIAKEKTEGKRPIGYDGKITIEELQTAVATGMDMSAFLAQCQQGKEVWKSAMQARMAEVYRGGPEFGYAKVRIPAGEGVQCAYSVGQVTQGATPTPGNVPKVDGFTYEDMIKAGWTNEQLLTAENGKYAVLVPQSMNAPVPPAPATPAVPPAPGAVNGAFEAPGI